MRLRTSFARRRYGVLCTLRDKMTRTACAHHGAAEDASKINRIVERFKLAQWIRKHQERNRKSRAAKQKENTPKGPDEKHLEKDATQHTTYELMAKPDQRSQSRTDNPNPTMATAKPSEPTYGAAESQGAVGRQSPSRAAEIKAAQKEQAGRREPQRQPQAVNKMPNPTATKSKKPRSG